MRFPFRLKVAVLTATVSALPLIGLGWVLVDINAREVESSSQAIQIALTDELAGQIERDLEEVDRSLRAIGRTFNDTELELDARVALALRLVDAAPQIDVVAAYGADGSLLDRMRDRSLVGVLTPESLNASLCARARTQGRAFGGLEVHDGEARLLVVVPVGDEGDAPPTGYLLTPWSLQRSQSLLERLSHAQLATRDGLLLVVDDAGRAVMHPDPSALGQPVDAIALEEEADISTLARAPQSAERRDAQGRTWLSTAVGLQSLPWAVVSLVPSDVAYASLIEMRRIALLAIAGTLLAAMIASFVFARRIAAPIQELVAFTHALAARRFDARVSIDTQDELSVLGEALSGAARELEASEDRIRQEMAIRADLGRYLSDELVEQIVRREQNMELGGQRRTITVVFADVVAFTPLSDRLPPEQVVAILNDLFTLLTEAVFRHGGTVDKFVGDCVMALFGAPAAQEDHATRALYAAQDMLRFLESANAGWKDQYGVEVRLAIGINTGEAVVGNVGSQKRMEYTAIGDVVNVAARLETIARPSQILVTRATAEAADPSFETVRIGEQRVAGRTQPVELFEVAW